MSKCAEYEDTQNLAIPYAEEAEINSWKVRMEVPKDYHSICIVKFTLSRLCPT